MVNSRISLDHDLIRQREIDNKRLEHVVKFTYNAFDKFSEKFPLIRNRFFSVEEDLQRHMLRTGVLVALSLEGISGLGSLSINFAGIMAGILHDVMKDKTPGRLDLIPLSKNQQGADVLKLHPYMAGYLLQQAFSDNTKYRRVLNHIVGLVMGHHELIIPEEATDRDGKEIQKYIREYAGRLLAIKQGMISGEYNTELRLLAVRTVIQVVDLAGALSDPTRKYNSKIKDNDEIIQFVRHRFGNEMIGKAFDELRTESNGKIVDEVKNEVISVIEIARERSLDVSLKVSDLEKSNKINWLLSSNNGKVQDVGEDLSQGALNTAMEMLIQSKRAPNIYELVPRAVLIRPMNTINMDPFTAWASDPSLHAFFLPPEQPEVQ